MTVKGVFMLSMYMIGEDPDAPDTEVYRSRAGELISSVCRDHLALDARYRRAAGAGASAWAGDTLSLEDDFPLHNRLAGAVAKATAVLLVAEENRELASFLDGEAKYDAIRIAEEIPGTVEKIKNLSGV